jgi:hypothetical protein
MKGDIPVQMNKTRERSTGTSMLKKKETVKLGRKKKEK